ncbi:type II secretion system F family protein [[Clostridium] polysaccharolyticum]|uniref:type II secretion system F family protein n=1 Tax=[Clostridium] polysaccharolyticum TaxID=29364 RepID=UPI0015A6F613|nr:type II secretion system F family protein [[Clostridium] polysaccharolyticum]
MLDWCIALFICWGVAYLFYENLIIAGLFSVGAFPIVYLLIKERIKKKKWQLTLQFKDGVVSLSNALAAGYSIENAFHEAVIDLRLLYDENSGIIKEFQKIEQQIRLNRNVEELLMKFGMQAGIEDIKDFAEIVMTAKRTGGDLIKIMKTTSNSIGEKIEVQREIQTLIAAKRFEGNIMTVIPLGIILYLKLCMPGFLRPLYEGVAGRGIMSIALTGYVLSLLLLRKIIDIKV